MLFFVFSFITAGVSIGLNSKNIFMSISEVLHTFNIFQIPHFTNYFITIVICLFASIFLSFFIFYIYNYLFRVFTQFIKIPKEIWHIIFTLTIILLIFCYIFFLLSDVFYSNKYLYNYIYSSDSPWHLQNNTVWLNINHTENDLRQPLFAIFSMPIIGPFSLLANFFEEGSCMYAFILNIPQILILVITNYLTIHLMNIKSIKVEKKLLIFIVFTYPVLLFSFMIEQYIVSVFYLLVFVHMSIKNKEENILPLIGSVGTLVSSSLLFFLIFDKKITKKENLKRLLIATILGISCLLLLGNQNIFQSIIEKVRLYISFSGIDVSICSRVIQFLSFVSYCFIAPKSIVMFNLDHMSWQVNNLYIFVVLGLVILICSFFGFYLTYQKKESQISMLWVVFSFFLLCVFGWGSRENGLILYTLYFSWAYFILIFQLFRRIKEKYCKSVYLELICNMTWTLIVLYNISRIFELVIFAYSYYPG